ncbi:hypothetical protein [Acinetobacter oleivorans]|uniref:hypothetical protein n=1 Tax=Acinetobacter oleivorans TaxID=1148157 RepID=UPI003A85DA03
MNKELGQTADSSEEIDENDVVIERVVPISNVEIMGLSVKKDEGSVLLELGYIKNEKTGDVIIDARKELPIKMAKDLYFRLKRIFESSDSAE